MPSSRPAQPPSIRTLLKATSDRIEAAATAAHRDPGDVRLLLAVKTVPATVIREAISAGSTLLGHNRAQELTAVEPELSDLTHRTHFIGSLQSNKVAQVRRWVSCVQTVDRLSLAHKLSRAVQGDPDASEPLEVFVQVNVSQEETKSGVAPERAAQFAFEVAALPGLRLRGFMTIGAHSDDLGLVRAGYDRLRELRDSVAGSDEPGTADAVELSMGMSADLEVAIAAGATIVRVGSAVFGGRQT